MFSILAILVSNPDGTQPTTVTIDWPNQNIDLGGPDVSFAAAPNQYDAIRLVLDQDTTDGETILSVQAAGGPIVTYNPAPNPADATVKVHGSFAGGWGIAKTEAYLDALVALGLD